MIAVNTFILTQDVPTAAIYLMTFVPSIHVCSKRAASTFAYAYKLLV